MIVEVSTGKEFYAHGLEKSRRDRIQIDIAIGRDRLICEDRHWIVPASSG